MIDFNNSSKALVLEYGLLCEKEYIQRFAA